MWQADHTPLDLWIVDERGQRARPLLTVVIDDYSRVIPGYLIGLHAPSALWTALALRQAIWRKGDPHWTACGIPDVFYTDHGSDFTSHHLEQVAAELSMRRAFRSPALRVDEAKSNVSTERSTSACCATCQATHQPAPAPPPSQSSPSASSTHAFAPGSSTSTTRTSTVIQLVQPRHPRNIACQAAIG